MRVGGCYGIICYNNFKEDNIAALSSNMHLYDTSNIDLKNGYEGGSGKEV